jgi:cyclophilin family peptidyl-prolyl cis-trans isomerase
VSPTLKHGEAGAVAMARSNDPNSASSQFYITLGPAAFLDGNYAVFGRVVEGLDVVQQIRKGDVMSKVTIANE